VQHHLRHAAGKKHLHGGEIPRAVGQRIDQTRNLAIDGGPIRSRGPLQASRVGDGRQVQQQIRRSAKRCVQNHRIAHRGLGQHVAHADA
jgi:hypothetical protein